MIENFNILSGSIFFLVLIIILILAYFYVSKFRQYKNNITNLVSLVFLFISVFVLIFGVIGFKLTSETKNAETAGVDIVYVLDVSKSMNVFDLEMEGRSFSRLDVAKSMMGDFISSNLENRYGLVVFAGDAISVSPLTTDYSTFLTFLDNVDYRNLQVQGSNFEKALELGVSRFNDDDRTKVLFLISDGGDSDDKIDYSYIESLQEDKDIKSIVFGVGTKSGGKIPNGTDFTGRIIYQRYNGSFVESSLNTSNLSKIADSLGGEYIGTESIEKAGSILSGLDKKVLELSSTSTVKQDGSRYLGMIAFIFFTLYLILPLFKSRGK